MLELAPYLLLGLLIAGLLNAFVSKKQVEKHLGKRNLASVIKAAILGVPLPLCSCGVIPTGIAFKKHGASNGATVSFLVSTPQTGIDSVLVTYSMLNLPWAIFRPIIAFFTGIAAGIAANKSDLITEENNPSNLIEETEIPKGSLFDRIIKYAFVDFLADISRPLITGIVLAVFITLAIPESLFANYLTYPLLNMLVVLLASVPLYVCATGSVPIAAALLMKGLSPGAALVFLMAGPATNAATITVLWKSLGKRTTLIYVGSIVFFSLLFGLLIDYILPAEWFNIMGGLSHHEHQHNTLPLWLQQSSAVILSLALLYIEIKKLIPHKIQIEEMEKAYKIEGMTCNHCKANVERALGELSNIETLEINLETATAKIKGDVSSDSIKNAVENIGYSFKGEVK